VYDDSNVCTTRTVRVHHAETPLAVAIGAKAWGGEGRPQTQVDFGECIRIMHSTNAYGVVVKHLTVRDIPVELGEALEKERRRRGVSLTRTVIDLLRQGVGLGPEGSRRNGLRDLAGTWTAEQHARFEAAIASVEQVDEELWR